MKTKYLSLILTLTIAGLTACSFNIGTTPNAANTANTAANSNANTAKPAATPTAETKPETTKKPEAETSKKTEGVDTKTEEQIQFPKGETETTIEKIIPAQGNKMYLFNAKKGQTLWFKVTETTEQLEVDFNKQSVSLGEEVRESLNASGDWAIYVNNPTDKPLKYKLWIGIE